MAGYGSSGADVPACRDDGDLFQAAADGAPPRPAAARGGGARRGACAAAVVVLASAWRGSAAAPLVGVLAAVAAAAAADDDDHPNAGEAPASSWPTTRTSSAATTSPARATFVARGAVVEPHRETLGVHTARLAVSGDGAAARELLATGVPGVHGRSNSSLLTNASSAHKAYERELLSTYVRRNIYTTSRGDRDRFLDSFLNLQAMSDAEAQTWGPDCHPLSYFLSIHLEMAAGRVSDKFHDGMGFLTQHAADERSSSSLRADPTVTIPYWDYTREGEAVIGSAGNASLTSNPYGLLRAPWNVNKSPFVSRLHKFCNYSMGYSIWPRRSRMMVVLPKQLYRAFMTNSPTCAMDVPQEECHMICTQSMKKPGMVDDLRAVTEVAEGLSGTGIPVDYKWLQTMNESQAEHLANVFCTTPFSPGEQIEAAARRLPSNIELLYAISPETYRMGYIYDNFADHCADKGWDFPKPSWVIEAEGDGGAF
ncbi:hypothetical protein JL721_12957 [Aureococcus anophagefferens]|nr:hypothetical protein JL721_12957 [Aureococcus anophagefferens]